MTGNAPATGGAAAAKASAPAPSTSSSSVSKRDIAIKRDVDAIAMYLDAAFVAKVFKLNPDVPALEFVCMNLTWSQRFLNNS